MITAVAIGLAALLATAALHHTLLMAATRTVPGAVRSHRGLPVWVFGQLAIIHLVEVALWAGLFVLVHKTLWPAAFGGSFAGSPADYVYFAGMAFTTLGQTGIALHGPMRILEMSLSLGGFMLLTWSASYLFTTCRTHFSE
ncbi:hypothetical protein JET14_12510 [Martelella lutilitoris]|uniref:Two pore domain potassium channel family protein n=1 Tax=Martelella lutilitoris TaxID=2583532 RepID=A0A7T7HHA0_9HYPH|nr:hypothetical protein [Martelella lutilitoris]QQM29156.1 hypothetical protein JET14_12510 [Martelella lutilitoris]